MKQKKFEVVNEGLGFRRECEGVQPSSQDLEEYASNWYTVWYFFSKYIMPDPNRNMEWKNECATEKKYFSFLRQRLRSHVKKIWVKMISLCGSVFSKGKLMESIGWNYITAWFCKFVYLEQDNMKLRHSSIQQLWWII